MAKKKRGKLTKESIYISRFGTGYTIQATRYYKVDGSSIDEREPFEEVYEDRVKLIEGLAKYLGLETTHRDGCYVPGVDSDVLCVLYPKPEKVA